MIKQCRRCGKDYKAKGNKETKEKSQFCSMKCFSFVPKNICVICKKEYLTHSLSRSKTSIYCSIKCKGIGSQKPRICIICKIIFLNPNPKVKCCSSICASISRRKNKYKNIECLVCKKNFIQNHLGQKLCSIKCSNEYQGINKVEIICIECQKKFKVSPSLVISRGIITKFCSIKCRDNNWNKTGWEKLLENNKYKQLNVPNKLEILGYSILDKLQIDYVKQYEIKDKFLVDALILKYKIIIQFDGDYWHGNINKFPNLTERQEKQILKDNSQNKYLEKCGYKIIRIWESDIKKDNNIIFNIINKTINV